MKKARLIALLMTLCMASACFLSGTVSKYTSTSTGTGTYDIAQWVFDVNDVNIAQTAAQTFDIKLGNTLDTDTTDPDADNQVASGKIAPGTKGSFTIVLENTSEVDATYNITYTVPQVGGQAMPFTYSVVTTVKDNVGNTVGSPTTVEVLNNVTGAAIARGQTVKVVVNWTWAYNNADNSIDTAIGIASTGTEDLVISATVTATQAD